jgi:transcriptional regulator
MYTPGHFKVEDQALLHQFMRRFSFATLISFGPQPQVSHLPFVVRTEPALLLVSHMARANPHWRLFAEANESLMIFQGPHAYVSPSLYESEQSVPTWNYSVVHAYGRARVREDTGAVLEEMIRFYDQTYLEQWNSLPDEYREKMKSAIVAFEIQVERLEGKFKMSQNRSIRDQENIVEEFAASNVADNAGVAEIMRANLTRKP